MNFFLYEKVFLTTNVCSTFWKNRWRHFALKTQINFNKSHQIISELLKLQTQRVLNFFFQIRQTTIARFKHSVWPTRAKKNNKISDSSRKKVESDRKFCTKIRKKKKASLQKVINKKCNEGWNDRGTTGLSDRYDIFNIGSIEKSFNWPWIVKINKFEINRKNIVI